MEEFPPKPRGMHWATYWRLEALEAAADNQWIAASLRASDAPRIPKSQGAETGTYSPCAAEYCTSDDERKTDVDPVIDPWVHFGPSSLQTRAIRRSPVGAR